VSLIFLQAKKSKHIGEGSIYVLEKVVDARLDTASDSLQDLGDFPQSSWQSL